ncbi:unnamed protein product [Effrenium voratum]|nr:unnamed protein product [Effrenium voratum]
MLDCVEPQSEEDHRHASRKDTYKTWPSFFVSRKGQLLLLILYPPKLIFKYDEQLSVVFFLLIAYALLISVTLMRVMYMRYAQDQRLGILGPLESRCAEKLPLTATWASAVFTCSCVLPTMLHIVLSVGQVMSAQRLRDESSIFCVVPKRIALAGKVRVACFDKTGTLTTSGLEFFGVHCLQSSGKGWDGFVLSTKRDTSIMFVFGGPIKEDVTTDIEDLEVLCGLACAHSLSPFAGTETGVVGNAVEVNMFQASGWTLSSATRVQGAFANQPHEVEITRLGERAVEKRFDFSHSTMTMSAIVQHKPSKERGVYVKGSFEHVLRLCRPESVPENFPQVRSQPLGRWGDLERIGFENAQTPSGPAGCFLCSTLFVEGVQPDTIKTTCPFPVDIHCSGSKEPLDSKSVCFEGTLGSGFHVLDGDNSAVPG